MTTPPALPDALAAYRAAAWTRAAGVAAAVVVALFVTAPIGWWVAGPAALWAAATAAAICLAGSLLSIAIGNFTATPEEVQAHVVFGMFLRMSLGLVACLAVYTQEGALVEGGMVYYLLAYYPLALAVETVQDVVALQSLFPFPRTRAPS